MDSKNVLLYTHITRAEKKDFERLTKADFEAFFTFN